MPVTERLLIIGLDGATFDLIDPWIAQGRLPHLASLMERGLRGPLQSTFPPATFPAWSSFMTGKNPGKHGLYDFVRLRPGSYRLEFVGARSRKGPTIWRLLSDHGLRVGIMGLPTTYPPEAVNGFMISGFDSPVSTGTDPSFIYPRSLFAELKERTGPYQITDLGQFRVNGRWHIRALDHIHQTLERKIAIAAYLLKKEPWDLFMVLFGESDTVGHHFWAFHDSRSPRYHRCDREDLSNAIRSVYQRLDAAIGELIALRHPGTSVMILSDHGFGGSGEKVIHLNRWLQREGYLSFAGRNGWKRAGASALRSAGLKLLPLKVQESLFRRGAGLADALLSETRMGAIRWRRTRAFSTEMNTLPGIWINLRGRCPQGIVAPGREYERLREALREDLGRFTDPETGHKVVARVYRREELYHGPCLQEAPDLLLELNLDRGYSYTCLPGGGRGDGEPIRRLRSRERLGAKGGSMNGSHRRQGIFLFARDGRAGSWGTGQNGDAGNGPAGRRQIERLSIMDLAPTILRFFGVPVPKDMDGRVIDEIVDNTPEEEGLHAEPEGGKPYAAARHHDR
jgi:predicted AlkP superfamily phosphohydrolase/phosphomutase